MRRNEEGVRLCDQNGCEFIATHTLVWAKHQCYCLFHTQHVLGLADFMGFPTPAATVRTMTPDEMYVGPDKPGEDSDA